MMFISSRQRVRLRLVLQMAELSHTQPQKYIITHANILHTPRCTPPRKIVLLPTVTDIYFKQQVVCGLNAQLKIDTPLQLRKTMGPYYICPRGLNIHILSVWKSACVGVYCYHNVLPWICIPSSCIFCIFLGNKDEGVDGHHSQLSAHRHPLPTQ